MSSETIKYLYEDEPTFRWEYEDMQKLLLWATEKGMSDLILNSNDRAWMRLHGSWQAVSVRKISSEELLPILNKMAKNEAAASIVTNGKDMDFAYEIEKDRYNRLRFRGNATPVADGYSTGVTLTLRTIPTLPPTMDALNVEDELIKSLFPGNGLILVTGVMGSGKSTLLAAILRNIAETSKRHIATYEAPIEFDLFNIPGKQGPIEQSEIPNHLEDFLRATRNSTRRAIDVVLVGESRDPETLRGMLESAEIGVAAYTTVHTRSVAATPTRIINVFEQKERQTMAASLLASLRVIIQQRLFPALNGGRQAAREYLVFTQGMREYLQSIPISALDVEIEKLVQSHGQPLEAATKKLVEEKRIGSEFLTAILAEKSSDDAVRNKGCRP